MQLFVIVTTVILMAGLTVFIARTQVGRAIATSLDLEGDVDDGHRRRPGDRRHVPHRLGVEALPAS